MKNPHETWIIQRQTGNKYFMIGEGQENVNVRNPSFAYEITAKSLSFWDQVIKWTHVSNKNIQAQECGNVFWTLHT